MDLLVIGTAAIFIFILLRMHYSSQEDYDNPETPDIWDSGEDPNERPPEGGEKL